MTAPMLQVSKSLIMAALKARLEALNYFGVVETKKIRLLTSDFDPQELPACQLISIGEEIQHERPRIKRNWIVHIEIVMRSSEAGLVDQTTLWDAQDLVERQLGGNLQLNLVGMVDITLRGTIDDLHIQEPFYTMRIEIACKYFTAYTGAP